MPALAAAHPDPIEIATGVRNARNAKLRAMSQSFGHIPGIPILTAWNSRLECANSAVHRSVMGGICGNKHDGAYSVVLSNAYKDDEDGGDTIIYTGSGGRKRWTDTSPPKRIRLGPQINDQSWEHPPNMALKRSSVTGNPIRVVRSWKCVSKYAPLQGYRYDGLYRVISCWTTKGHSGRKICRCRLERLPDQPMIPLRPITIYASAKIQRRSNLICKPFSKALTSTNPTAARLDTADQSDVDFAPNCEIRRMDQDLHLEGSQLLPPELRDLPDALPRYWDQIMSGLVGIPPSCPIPEDHIIPEGGEDGGDGVTVIPAEHFDVPTNELTSLVHRAPVDL